MWRKVKLDEICTKITDGSHNPPKQIEHSDFIMLSSKNVFDDEINFDKPRYLTEEDFIKENRRTDVQVGDVLLTIVGTIGRCAIVENLVQRFTLQRSVAVLKPVHDLVLPRFLMYTLHNMIDELTQGARGVAQKGIYLKSLKKLSLSLPPIPVQKQIVEKLDAAFADIDKAISATEKNIENAEAFYRSNLEYKINSINAEDEELGKILKLEYGKGLPKEDRNDDGAYPAYGANGIKYKTNNFLYENPSIIVGRKGSAGEITLTEPKFWALDVTYYVTFDEERYSLDFLYYLLKKLNLSSLATGVKPGINRNNVYSISVKIPTLSSQKRISAALKETDTRYNKLLSIYQQKLSEYINLKSAILNQAFSGELTKDAA